MKFRKSKAVGKDGLAGSFRLGAIAFVFLVVGFDAALFIHRAAVLHIVAGRDAPDTVYIVKYIENDNVASGAEEPVTDGSPHPSDKPAVRLEVQRREASHERLARSVRQSVPRTQPELFAFNPNTVSEDELMRLGFTPKQASSIVSYRSKGGRFRRREDFARSFVVSDEMYSRLEPFIEIPLTDINEADSAAFDALPGIGGWFASKMVSYRTELGGYTCKEQLMDIWKIDSVKYAAFEDLIEVRKPYRYPLWSLPADSLRLHPYIRSWTLARAIVLYREHNPESAWRADSLLRRGVVTREQAARLRLLENFGGK
ncbi:MAG: helix-hairpin-helix domain-containing protein [Bacteroidales bacterium]|nr:helix-hairpin-helix domain-containing protein [Bacteroidales bacterium]